MNPAPMILEDCHCELCCHRIPPEDVSVEAFEASGLLICTQCLEGLMDEEPFTHATEQRSFG